LIDSTKTSVCEWYYVKIRKTVRNDKNNMD
jgi:hypothetical protein